ncbi:MAG: (d)CMP kinase [Gammaproteobacteria bacterium]
MTVPVITIDGPSGAGKGTAARLIALELGFHLLDSGAIYRILGLAATDAQIELDDIDSLVSLSNSLDLSFPYDAEGTEIVLNSVSVGNQLRTQVVADAASQVAIHPPVRDALMGLQRRQARDPGLVGDGRDLGTIVFPGANLKIFLDASVEVRAERRYLELIESGQIVERSAILRDLEIRDVRDRTRKVAPLVPADDAYVIDSSDKTAAQVVADVRDLCRAKGLA